MNARAILLALGLASLPGAPLFADFLRGDANQDRSVDVSDAVTLLIHLFLDRGTLTCEDAADANDDGAIDLSDVIDGLGFLFGDRLLPYPGTREPGPDPTCDPMGCAASPDLAPPVVISEISYNPAGNLDTFEFVELHNRTDIDIDLGGYRFIHGIDFTFPPDTILAARGFLMVLKDPDLSSWRRLETPKAGPYDGWLADGGERLTLLGACDGETVLFDDAPPWPIGPDGYGPSLERIDYSASSADFHSWRTSSAPRGTPGAPNTTAGTPPRPVIVSWAASPPRPSSNDEVTLRIVLDAPDRPIESATLHWETLALAAPVAGEPLEMNRVPGGSDGFVLEATLPPQPSQTLVRANLELRFADSTTLLLPHPADPDAVLSYFVYDFEIETALRLMWLYPRRLSLLPLSSASRRRSAAVALDPGAESVLVFDGADLSPRARSDGLNLKFLKRREYRGDRSLNIIPERGNGGTGTMAPHMEHLGFDVWRDLGGLVPRADWFRIVESSDSARPHTQRLVIQQVNERFLEMNGIDPSGDLYKLDHKLGGWAKRTNLSTGFASMGELLLRLRHPSIELRRQAILQFLDVDNVRLYSVVGMLIGNWDGFHNNLFAYQDPSPGGKWILIPWDLDQVFQVPLWNFTVVFPLTGHNAAFPGVNRETGPISRPFHTVPEFHRAYLDDMKALIEDGSFTVESVNAKVDAVEALLLEDLALEEALLGTRRDARRAQIRSSYAHIRQYMERRIPYLLAVLD